MYNKQEKFKVLLTIYNYYTPKPYIFMFLKQLKYPFVRDFTIFNYSKPAFIFVEVKNSYVA